MPTNENESQILIGGLLFATGFGLLFMFLEAIATNHFHGWLLGGLLSGALIYSGLHLGIRQVMRRR